jgi:hypothetical protein
MKIAELAAEIEEDFDVYIGTIIKAPAQPFPPTLR